MKVAGAFMVPRRSFGIGVQNSGFKVSDLGCRPSHSRDSLKAWGSRGAQGFAGEHIASLCRNTQLHLCQCKDF